MHPQTVERLRWLREHSGGAPEAVRDLFQIVEALVVEHEATMDAVRALDARVDAQEGLNPADADDLDAVRGDVAGLEARVEDLANRVDALDDDLRG